MAWIVLSCAGRHPASLRDMRGFTLIEVLLATALLAAGLALAFSTIHGARVAVQRGEQLAQRNEHMRAVHGFLRRRVSSALPLGFATDPVSGQPMRFVGEPARMRFVADLPAYLGRGGPHLHELVVADADDGDLRLTVAFAMVLAGKTVPAQEPRPPELLATRLEQVRFRYRGLDAQNRPGPWTTHWRTVGHLPLQVAIEIVGADGDRWPPLIVALPQATSAAAGGARILP